MRKKILPSKAKYTQSTRLIFDEKVGEQANFWKKIGKFFIKLNLN